MKPWHRAEATHLYLGDASEVMASLPAASFDLIITSPPYNLRNTSGGAFSGANRCGKWQTAALAHGYANHSDDMEYAQYVAWQHDVWHAMWRLLDDRGAIFYVHKPRVQDATLQLPTDLVPPDLRPFLRQIIIWARNGGVNFNPTHFLPTHEWIVVVAKRDFRLRSKGASGAGDVWHIAHDLNNDHPAPFPLALVQRIFDHVPGERILDPFVGSGTTLTAALLSGKSHAAGIDNAPEYLAMTRERLELASAHLLSGRSRRQVALGQLAMFAERSPSKDD